MIIFQGQNYASAYSEIDSAISTNIAVKNEMLRLLSSIPQLAGKALQVQNNSSTFKALLNDYLQGTKTLAQLHSGMSSMSTTADNRTFATNWETRLIETTINFLYSHSVGTVLLALGQADCHVPHTNTEQGNSHCTANMAGRNFNIPTILATNYGAYVNGIFVVPQDKIPNHPHCSHVVAPKI